MPTLPPEQAAVLAQELFEQGDVVTAAQHIGRALVADPHRKEWLALLTQILDSVLDPLELAPLRPGGVSVGEIAVRAYAMFKRQRYHDAIDLILQAAVAAPGSPLLDWALSWLKKPETATSVNCLKLHHRFKTIQDDLPRLRAAAGGATPLLVRLAPLIKRLRETQVCDAAFLVLMVSLLRRIPELREAYECAREAHELEPSYATCVALAGVFRDREDYERAARWYQSALENKTDDVAVRLDLGDMLWRAGRIDEAEHWYRAALKVEPKNEWATPSLYAVRFERTRDDEWKERLDDYARAHPDNPRAREMRDRIGPYFGTWLPEPAEESLRIVRMMADKWEAGDDILIEGMPLSSLEAPSVYLAYNLQLARQKKKGQLTLDVESVPRPDVRRPRVPVTYQVWRYRGTEPQPALTPPPQWAIEAVAKIAAEPYDLRAWQRRAADVGQHWGSTRVRELLAVMVHPPPLPAEFTPWAWVQRVQIAAALLVSKLERGWNGSVRRQALFDVANGPLDWTTSAAILALAILTDDEPGTADEVAGLFNELLRDAPQGGYICHLHALVCSYQRLPNITAQEHRDLARWRRELERA